MFSLDGSTAMTLARGNSVRKNIVASPMLAPTSKICEWPLTSSFVYSWPLESLANSALMFISAFAKHAVNVLTSNAIIKGSFRPWCVFTHSMCDAAQVEILPSIFFDPPFSEGNPFHSQASDFFKNLGPEFSLVEALPRSYAFHWHNQWSASIEAGSPASLLLEDSEAH